MSIFDEIIQNIPAANSTSNIAPASTQALDTLMLELEHLKNHRKYCFVTFHSQKVVFSSFQHVDDFKQTTHVLNSFSANNSNLSAMQRTQGNLFQNFIVLYDLGPTYLCWAFSCASMLRASCTILIKKLYEAGKISGTRKQQCLDLITSERNHEKIRNLIAMILLPKKLHKSDESQSAFLRAAVSRVSCQETKF